MIQMIGVFLMLTTPPPPRMNHEHPTRANGIAVVTYWEQRTTYLEHNPNRNQIEQAFKACAFEVASWDGRYDLHQTRRLRLSFERLVTLLKITPIKRDT